MSPAERNSQMKQMIRNEIQSIGNMGERVVFKELMEEIFLSLYETNEQMYQELEQRVMEELSFDMNRYLIKTGLIEKQYMDCTHHLMFPIDEMDLTDPTYKLSDIVGGIRENGNYTLMKIMIQMDYMQLQELWEQNHQFQGILELKNKGKQEFTIELRPNIKYLSVISHLYQLFNRNGIPWQTVNIPYLYKMVDVIITELPEGVKGDETILRFQIDFGKYSPYVHYDLVPVWNIEKIKLSTIGFPVPCEDHKSFEHIVSIGNHGEEHAYLIDEDTTIKNIFQRGNKLFVTSQTDEAKKWNIYMIRNAMEKKIDHYTYPIMQNLRTENFSEKFQRKWNQEIKTKTELKRFINGFELEDYLVFRDCIVKKYFDGEPETYCMNSFIEDEIRNTQNAMKLILYFIPGSHEPWLIRDIASFIVSEVQRIYPEYECGGKLL